MLKSKERQMVLDYLYQECVVASQVPSEILKRTGCMLEAKMKYESLSTKERIKIYSQLLEKKIINYLIDNITNSLVLHWVNGSPKKREIRINEYAQNQYRLLSKAEKIAICEKLQLIYLNG
jgi:hypothetical protein